MKRLRVLVSAYACEPGKGSEPAIGWNTVLALAAHHDVWVITRANNRGVIEAALRQAPVPGLHFVYHDLPAWARWWKRGARGADTYYYLWQLTVYQLARRLHERHRFDVVHHVTYGRYWSPSLLALLPAPFVLGPVGGGESAPKGFWKTFGWKGIVYEAIREGTRWAASLDPLVRLTVRRSDVAFATTDETAARLRRLGARDVRLLPAISVLDADVAEVERPARRPHLRFVSIGRLLHWKGFHLGLQAFAQADLPGVDFWIIGEGPDRPRLERLVRALGVEDRVTFAGRLGRDDVLRALQPGDVLVLPSFHDSGGMVCLEAMAARMPVLCLELGGPAVLVPPEAGVHVPARSPEQVTAGLREAMIRLAADPDLRRAMGEAGRRHVCATYLWDVRVGPLLDAYEQVLQVPHAVAG